MHVHQPVKCCTKSYISEAQYQYSSTEEEHDSTEREKVNCDRDKDLKSIRNAEELSCQYSFSMKRFWDLNPWIWEIKTFVTLDPIYCLFAVSTRNEIYKKVDNTQIFYFNTQ